MKGKEVAALAGHALGVIQAAERFAAAEFERRKAEAESARQGTARVGEQGAREAVSRDFAAALEATSALAPGAAAAPIRRGMGLSTSTLDQASYVRFGESIFPGTQQALPLLASLLDRGNLVLEGEFDSAAMIGHIHTLSLRTLLGTGAGQLVLHGFDPALRGLFAPFAALRGLTNPLLTDITTSPAEVADLLEHLTEDVRRVGDLRQGRDVTLGQLRQAARQPVEKYQLMVLLDYPKGMTPEIIDRLHAVMRAGPPCGVSFIVHGDTQGTLSDVADVISVRPGGASWSRCPDVVVALDGPPPPRLIAELVQEVASQADQAAAPHLGLAELLAGQEERSSAEGITVPIGRAGTQVVELTLGDEREQRHNVLVTGAVGQGKSNFLKVLIHGLASAYPMNELLFYLIDLKDGVSFYPLAATPDSPDWLPQAAVIGLESDREFAVAVLEFLFQEFERRAHLIRPHGDKISAYRARVPGAVMPRILVVIDEFQVLFEEDDEISGQAVSQIERLARRGRAYGIHLVLASQTISGITAMLGKQDGIYSQFPVRIAFKNSVSESLAVLDSHNPDAALLRFRGEAIVNLDFGQRRSNQLAIVAAADPPELERIRRQSWSRRPTGSLPPQVFQGALPAQLTAAIPRLHELRAEVLRQPAGGRVGLLGLPVALPLVPNGFSLTQDPGRHVAILGGAQRRSGPDGQNLALGAMQAAAVSLALQHPRGDASFMLVNLLNAADAEGSGMDDFMWLMERLGFPLRVIGPADFLAVLKELSERVAEPGDGGALYVLGAGLDRAGGLDRPNEMFETGLDLLRAVLRQGPVNRVHVIGWWSSVGIYRSQLGFDSSVEIDTMLALRVSQRDVVDLMGHTVTWNPKDNRALLYDRHEFAQPVTLVPMAPLSRAVAQAILRESWAAS